MMKSEQSRFLKKNPPPPFWAQKGQIWAKIALFRNFGKNGSNDFFKTLNTEYQNGYEKTSWAWCPVVYHLLGLYI